MQAVSKQSKLCQCNGFAFHAMTCYAPTNMVVEPAGNECPCCSQFWGLHCCTGLLSPSCKHMLHAGYTGCQPRLEQMMGTPDYTQRTVVACDPEAEKTHCRLIPSYAGLANTPGLRQQSSRGIPKLNMATVSAQKGHAGKDPCLLAGQCSSRAGPGVQSGPVCAQDNTMRLSQNTMGNSPNFIGSPASPAQARTAGGAAVPQALTARPATCGGPCGGSYGMGQAAFQPMSARTVQRPTTGHYHGGSSGACTWRGTYQVPLALGSSRYMLFDMGCLIAQICVSVLYCQTLDASSLACTCSWQPANFDFLCTFSAHLSSSGPANECCISCTFVCHEQVGAPAYAF